MYNLSQDPDETTKIPLTSVWVTRSEKGQNFSRDVCKNKNESTDVESDSTNRMKRRR